VYVTKLRGGLVLLITVCGVLTAGAARAQEARGGGGGASAQVVAELQQLSAQSASLKTENEQLKKRLAAVTAERDRLKNGESAAGLRARSSEAALARSNAEEAGTQAKLTQTQAAMQQLIAKFREVVDSLRKTEVDEARVKQTLAMRQEDLRSCAERNTALYKLDDEVLTHFERQSFWSRLASEEPFTRIERVRLQNYADETRGRAEEERYAPRAAGASSK
jgi:chromosome segregation ATPase